MKPQLNKWYLIRYGKKGSKRAFHGAAKCINTFKEDKYLEDGDYIFISPLNENECLNRHMIFKEQDIIKEVDPLPSYKELYMFYKNALEWHKKWKVELDK